MAIKYELAPDILVRLREIAKRDEEEIKKAEDLIRQSEAEIEEGRRALMPEIEEVDVGRLFRRRAREEELEETVSKEKTREGAAEEAQRQYQLQLSREPAEELATRAKDIYAAVKESGYVSPAQMEEIADMSYAMEIKKADKSRGAYAPESEKFSEEVSAFSGIIRVLKDRYKGR